MTGRERAACLKASHTSAGRYVNWHEQANYRVYPRFHSEAGAVRPRPRGPAGRDRALLRCRGLPWSSKIFTEIETAEGCRCARSPRATEVGVAARPQPSKCPIVVAKLDRLSPRRRVYQTGLMAQGVPFIVTEIPNADPFMLHIYAAVAEQERTEIVAEELRLVWLLPRPRGPKLGNPHGPTPFTAEMQQQGVAALRQQADARARQLQRDFRRICW